SKQGKKRFPLPSGLLKTFGIPDKHSTSSQSEQHFVFELALELSFVIPRKHESPAQQATT
ncbi:hypothetical protein, partial [Flavobacterium sp. LMO9]|uniref:hypothetical protein n=1 Tax=Flavobacterium sp. LMO9 TaxID=2654245 RepID=UPI00193A99DA